MNASIAAALVETVELNLISARHAARSQLEFASQALLGCAARASDANDAAALVLEVDGIHRLMDMVVASLDAVRSGLEAYGIVQAAANAPPPPKSAEIGPVRVRPEALVPADRATHFRRIGNEVAEAAALTAHNLTGLSDAMANIVAEMSEQPGAGPQPEQLDLSKLNSLLTLSRTSNGLLDERLRQLGEIGSCAGSA